jgi:hypothetical protein
MQRIGLIGYSTIKITDVMERARYNGLFYSIYGINGCFCVFYCFQRLVGEECNSNYKQYYCLPTQTRYYENKTR